MKNTIVFLLLLTTACTTKRDIYTIESYEWRPSKQLTNIMTATYTIRHGKSVIHAECIGSKGQSGFEALSCTPPLPVGEELSMKAEGTELICQFKGREVDLEVISEELR